MMPFGAIPLLMKAAGPNADAPKVPVVMFGGAAKNVKPPERNLPPNFSEEDLAVLDNLERISQGEEPHAPMQKIMPAQMVAALVRLLIKKRVIQEEEYAPLMAYVRRLGEIASR